MMRKKENHINEEQEQDSYTMIELAAEDIEALAKAFGMLDDLYQSENEEEGIFEVPEDVIWN